MSLGARDGVSLSKSDSGRNEGLVGEGVFLGGGGRESLRKGVSPGPSERERGNPGKVHG